MGRRRGGYLGGSTIISLSKASGPADEGPIAALERARIENTQLDADRNARLLRQESADEKLAAVESALHKLAICVENDLTDVAAKFSDVIARFLAEEAGALSASGPGPRRRLNNVQGDYRLLVEALSAEESDRFGILWKTTVYQTHIAPIYEAALRKPRPPSR